MNINTVTLSGKLTRDSEMRATAGGTPVLGFGIAVNDRVKNRTTGEWENRPNFFDCVVYGARAEKLASYLKKGTSLTIEGKLRWNQWEVEGQKHSKVIVVVNELDFYNNKPNEKVDAPSKVEVDAETEPDFLAELPF